MRTDPKQLHRVTFDVVVIGAGIHGAAIARDAALRGLSALLVDARDVAAGASARTSSVIDAGLRDLRRGRFVAAREALQERERLLRTAPHIVRPLPMLAPCYDHVTEAPARLWIATTLSSRLARRSTLPRPRRLDAGAAIAAFPGLQSRGLRSGLLFFEARVQDARLTLANVLDAVAAGAVFCNHAEVAGCDADGVTLRAAGAEVVIKARELVNAAGSSVDIVRRSLGGEGPDLVRARRVRRVVMPARIGELALCAFLPGDLAHAVVPHAGGALCSAEEGAAQQSELSSRDRVDQICASFARLLDPPPRRQDICRVVSCSRALPRGVDELRARHDPPLIVSEDVSCGRLHTVVGCRFTSHRAFAERAVASIFGLSHASPTRTRPLPGGDGPREVSDDLWWRHGSRLGALRASVAAAPELGERLCEHRPFLTAELIDAVQRQGAVTFADAMLRRLVDVRGPCTEPACLRRAIVVFQRAGGEVGDEDREIAAIVEESRGESSGWQREDS